MGAVYRADDVTSRMEVAVKVLHAPFAVDERAVARFRREAMAASQLKHDGCVEIIAFGIDRERPYIAMELLQGETLHELLERKGRLSALQTLRIGVQVCAALEAAHERGIVHRDLKPENIMVLSGWSRDAVRVKILDFGIAKLVTPMTGESSSWETNVEKLTQPGTALGTPAFMAPEQVRGDAIDDRTDIYVVGILLYEMVTGSVPFGGDDPVQVLTAQLREQPAPPSTLVPGLHPELERAILTAMEKSRAARWPTARVMRQFLEQLAGELSDATSDDEVTEEETDDEDDYGLTEPVNLKWARERIAALKAIGGDKSPGVAPSAAEQRSTSDSSRGTMETRVVRPGADGVSGLLRRPPAPDETRDPADDIPTIEVYDDESVDIEMEIETVIKERDPIPNLEAAIARAKAVTAARGVKRGGSASMAASQQDAAMAEEESISDIDTVRQDKSRLPQNVRDALANAPRVQATSPRTAGALTAEDLDSVTQPQERDNLPGKLAELLEDSALSVSTGDIEIVAEEDDDDVPTSRSTKHLTALVEDSSLDRVPPEVASALASHEDEDEFDGEATVARPPRGPDGRPSPSPDDDDDGMATVIKPMSSDDDDGMATAIKPMSSDDDDGMATTVKPISDDAIDAAVATAVTRQTNLEADEPLPTAVTRQTSLEADEPMPTAVTRQTSVPDEDMAPTMVQSPEEAAAELERAKAARARQLAGAEAAPDWDDDAKPTAMMPRSQLSDGLPPELRAKLQAELGSALEPTVDEPAPDLPPLGFDSESSMPSPPGAAQRPAPTAPLPAVDPRQVGALRQFEARGPSVLPPAFVPNGGDDLDAMLRRMPRTRYPVFSTLMAIIIMVAAAAGLAWLVLF
jgi:serine/threonine-protein kinase